jgi:hypothetical protein
MSQIPVLPGEWGVKTANSKVVIKKPDVRASHRTAANSFLDSVSGPFRRSALSKVLYPLTAPRSAQRADQLADSLMRELSKLGKIQRHGHLHWVKVSLERVLRSGRVVPELADTVSLTLTTRCPAKWLSLDMETGDVWVGSAAGWRRATAAEHKEAVACLERSSK